MGHAQVCTHTCACGCVCMRVCVCKHSCVHEYVCAPLGARAYREGSEWPLVDTKGVRSELEQRGGAALNRVDPRVRWDTELKGNEVKTRSPDSVRRWLSKSAVSEPTQLPPFLASHNLSCLGHAGIWLHLVYSFVDCYVLFHV